MTDETRRQATRLELDWPELERDAQLVLRLFQEIEAFDAARRLRVALQGPLPLSARASAAALLFGIEHLLLAEQALQEARMLLKVS